MPDVQGRFDHMAVDNKTGRLFAAVYGNDSVEVLEVQRGRRVHRIQAGFSKPQMVGYLPESNRIVVSNEGDGSCRWRFRFVKGCPFCNVILSSVFQKFAFDKGEIDWRILVPGLLSPVSVMGVSDVRV
jgi:hypothetical protein